MATAEQVVQKQLDFYNSHDLEGFLSTFHNGIKLYNLADNTLILQGKEQLRERYRERLEVLKVRAVIKSRIVVENKVIDDESVFGLKPNTAVNAKVVYDVVDDLITKFWIMSDM